VKFLLATTDPQKLPVTVLSRCLQFHLKNLAPAQIVTYLQSVLIAEQVEFEDEALWHLARAATGSMRDALTLLDQSISFGAGKVYASAVSSLLGTPDFALIFLLIEALAKRSAADIIQRVREVAESSPDYQRLLEQMLSVFHRIAIAQMLPDAVDNSEGDRDNVISQAAALSSEDVQLYYQICQQTLQEMSVSPDKRVSFEMGLLRMLAFSPDVFLADKSAALEKKKPELTSVVPKLAETNPVFEAIESTVQVNAPLDAPTLHATTRAAAVPDIPVTPSPTLVLTRPQDKARDSDSDSDFALASAVSSGPSPRDNSAADEDWYAIVSSCALSGISGNILWNCIVESIQPDCYHLILDESQSALFSPDHQQAIAAALSDYGNTSVKVEIRVASVSKETPAARRRREKSEVIASIHQTFYDDVGVNALLAAFDAKIEQDSLEIVR
jgi:DNA polymerase-3 subunit gamma/tau